MMLPTCIFSNTELVRSMLWGVLLSTKVPLRFEQRSKVLLVLHCKSCYHSLGAP